MSLQPSASVDLSLSYKLFCPGRCGLVSFLSVTAKILGFFLYFGTINELETKLFVGQRGLQWVCQKVYFLLSAVYFLLSTIYYLWSSDKPCPGLPLIFCQSPEHCLANLTFLVKVSTFYCLLSIVYCLLTTIPQIWCHSSFCLQLMAGIT